MIYPRPMNNEDIQLVTYVLWLLLVCVFIDTTTSAQPMVYPPTLLCTVVGR